MFANAVIVFLGGAFGSLSRFFITEAMPIHRWGIPFTIMLVNFAGCFIMGFIDSLTDGSMAGDRMKHFAVVGFLGGFTTFSSFSLEFGNLAKAGSFLNSFMYLILSVFTGLAGFFAGYMLAKVFK